MKIKWKNVYYNFITLGLFGVKEASKIAKVVQEKEKVRLLDDVVHLMFLVPILSGLYVLSNFIAFDPPGLMVYNFLRIMIFTFAFFSFLSFFFAALCLEKFEQMNFSRKLKFFMFGSYAIGWQEWEKRKQVKSGVQDTSEPTSQP